jgi:hypothetical protein
VKDTDGGRTKAFKSPRAPHSFLILSSLTPAPQFTNNPHRSSVLLCPPSLLPPCRATHPHLSSPFCIRSI